MESSLRSPRPPLGPRVNRPAPHHSALASTLVALAATTMPACPTDAEVAADVAADASVDAGPDITDVVDTDVDVLPPGTVRATFRPSAGEVPNPDRGFYTFVDDLRALVPEDLADVYDAGVRLVYTPIRLDAHRDADLPESELALMSEGMDRIRDAGLGLIVRFVYNYPESEEDYLDAEDAPLDRVRAHVAQLAPLVRAHADIVTFWQAGFIGAWGEWHSSSSGLDAPAMKDQVRDALLEVLPPDTFLQLRYPPDLARLTPSAPDEVDFAATARARVGFHNDCFMSSDTDVGTFEDGQDDPLRTWVADLARVVPVGGETCNADEPTPQRRGCADILAEGARYRFTYLNRDYHTAFHDQWRREGCFDEVTRSLGYRLELDAVSHPAEALAGAPMELTVTITNSGWARPFTPRRLVFELSSAEATHRLETTLDARRWTPGEHTLTQTLLLPALAPGRYAVAVGLPHEDPRRALRFAIDPDPALGQSLRADGLVLTGTSLDVVAPQEARWHPRDLLDARVFDAAFGVTLDEAPAPNRWFHTQAASSPWHPRDGAGLVWFDDRLWLLGGWYSGLVAEWSGAITTNEVWVSDDLGQTWSMVLAHDPAPPQSGPGARWPGRHTVGFLTLPVDGVEHLYVIGGDAFHPSGDVWRSRDGAIWEAVTHEAPWHGRILQMAAKYRGDLYVMGGQTELDDPSTALADVWRSHDGGATWERLADAPWAPRAMVYDPFEHDGRLWLIGGGTYDDLPRTYFNDVWTFDGERWTEVLPNGRAPFLAREYHNTFAYDGELWVASGWGANAQNLPDFWHSQDGVTWRLLAGTLPRPGHGDGIAVTPHGLFHASGNAMDTEVHLMTTREGVARLSGWRDLGAAAATLGAVGDARPVWLARAFGERPAVALDGGQAYLSLARREAQPDGRSVFWLGATRRLGPWPAWVNPAMTVVGDSIGACRAQAGYSDDGAELVVTDALGDWSDGHVRRGADLADGRAHLIGFTHATDGTVQAWIDGARAGAPVVTSYDREYMGWDLVGAGFATGSRAQVALAAVVVAPRVLNDDEIERLSRWAADVIGEPLR